MAHILGSLGEPLTKQEIAQVISDGKPDEDGQVRRRLPRGRVRSERTTPPDTPAALHSRRLT